MTAALSPELAELVACKEVPDGIQNVERVLDFYGYNYSGRGKQMKLYNFPPDVEAYVRLLLKRRTSRREDARRKTDENIQAKRNAYYNERHKRRREEADNSVEKLAWFNVTFLFANLRRRGLTCALSRQEALEISQRPCFYCGDVRSGGLDRKDSLGDYTIENVVPACKMCNYMKGGMNAQHFIAYCVSVDKRLVVTVTGRGIFSAFTKSRNSARDRGREFLLTQAEYDGIVARECSTCRLPHCRGVDRIDSSLGYTLANTRPMCFVCNYVKGQFDDNELKHQFHKITLLHGDAPTSFTGFSRFTSAVWKFVDGMEATLCNEQ